MEVVFPCDFHRPWCSLPLADEVSAYVWYRASPEEDTGSTSCVHDRGPLVPMTLMALPFSFGDIARQLEAQLKKGAAFIRVLVCFEKGPKHEAF